MKPSLRGWPTTPFPVFRLDPGVHNLRDAPPYTMRNQPSHVSLLGFNMRRNCEKQFSDMLVHMGTPLCQDVRHICLVSIGTSIVLTGCVRSPSKLLLPTIDILHHQPHTTLWWWWWWWWWWWCGRRLDPTRPSL
jgi:hypothetical protein